MAGMINPILKASKRKASPPAEDDGQSILGKIGSTALSGLSRIANTFDVPGGVIRNTLAGDNPLAPLWHPTTSEGRVSGRDLLRTHGLVGADDTWANFGAGLAVDIATDPFTWIGPGALTKAASSGIKGLGAASKVADAARAGGGLLSVGVPFVNSTTKEVLTGAAAHGAADRLRKAAEYLGTSYPVRSALQMLDSSKMGRITAEGQDIGAQTFERQTHGIQQVKGLTTGIARDLEKAGKATPEGATALRREIEIGIPESLAKGQEASPAYIWQNGKQHSAHDNYVMDQLGTVYERDVDRWDVVGYSGDGKRLTADKAPDFNLPTKMLSDRDVQELIEAGHAYVTPKPAEAIAKTPVSEEAWKLADMFATYKTKSEWAGLKAHELDDEIGYAMRQLNENLIDAPSSDKVFGPFGGKSSKDVGRLQLLKGFQEGTEGVNKLFADQGLKGKVNTWNQQIEAARTGGQPQSAINALRKQATQDIEQHINQAHGTAITQQFQPVNDAGKKLWQDSNGKKVWSRTAPQGATAVMKDRHAGLASMALDSPKWFEHTPFPNNPVVDAEVYALSHENRIRAAQTIYEKVAKLAQPGSQMPLDQSMHLGKLFKGLGVNVRTASQRVADELGIPWSKQAAKDILSMRIGKDVGEDLLGKWPTYQIPKNSGLLLNSLDSMQNLWKAGVLTWPATIVRNATSGAIQNVMKGWMDIGSFVDAHRLAQGQTIKNLTGIREIRDWLHANNLPATDEHATEALRQIYAAHHTGGHAMRDTTSAAMPNVDPSIESLLGRVPGRVPTTESESIQKVASTTAGMTPDTNLNPLNVRGFNGRTESTFGPAAASDMLNEYVDTLNRAAPLIYRMRQGHSAAQAMKEIAEAQVDYSARAFTAEERSIMKRAFPFYSFCVPESHEALTVNGWKKWHEIREGELLLTYKQETGELEWQPAQAINVFDHDGELIEIFRTRKTRRYAFQFTDNHRWPVKREEMVYVPIGQNARKRTRVVNQSPTFVTGENLKTGDRLICSGEFRGRTSVLSPRLASILGWVVTDGYFRWRSTHGKKCEPGVGSCEMIVYQSPGKHLDELIALLGTTPRAPHPDTGVCAIPVSRDDTVAICKVFGSKPDLCRIVGGLSRKAAEAMWGAMFMAEGTTANETGQRHFGQSPEVNPEVTDAFQILCLLTGKTANASGFGMTVRKRKTYRFDKKKQSKRVHYAGKVWCPTTANGTWVMRHDGQVVITGNSKSQLYYLAKELLSNPGGRMRQTIRATAQARGNDPGIPDYIGETAAVPLGESPDGTKRFVTGFGLMHEDPASFFGSPQEALLEAASRSNPLIKAPLEFMTGQSFFQRGTDGGRPLGDLDPAIGRTLANVGNLTGLRQSTDAVRYPFSGAVEQISANSPASRLITTARTLTDTRKDPLTKAANLLTGMRIADVSPSAQDRATLDKAMALLKQSGGREFTDVSVPKDRLENMAPAQQALVEKLLELKREIESRRRSRKNALQAAVQ